MASTDETKKEHGRGGHKHGPPSEEERRQREAEFKQEFLDEYRKQYGDSLISAEQTWELYQAVQERRHAKKKERHHEDREHSPHHRGPSPNHWEEKRKKILAELQTEFQSDFTSGYGANKVNAEQAWSLIQKIKEKKHEKWENDRRMHGHGPRDHRRHSPPQS